MHTLVIQCKRWSQDKQIREKHVNQLFGTLTMYRFDHPFENATGVLYTTTVLSDRAKEFARALGIEFVENYPFRPYPAIKCNVSRTTGEHIYHLPFDQQYDHVLIEQERHERYVETVEEAEGLGYRRAWRWQGEQSSVA